MNINERNEQPNDNEIRSDEIERRKGKKPKNPGHVEDQQYNSWDVASATQVAIQISALAAIIEQNRRLSEESALPTCQNSNLPQWNGIRISHPMDPRIDLRTVGHIPGSSVPVASSDAMEMHSNMSAHQSVPAVSVDNYLNLMEVRYDWDAFVVRSLLFLTFSFRLPSRLFDLTFTPTDSLCLLYQMIQVCQRHVKMGLDQITTVVRDPRKDSLPSLLQQKRANPVIRQTANRTTSRLKSSQRKPPVTHPQQLL